jgi:hypothetical protein
MSDRHQVRHLDLLFQPNHQWLDTVLVLRGLDRPTLAGSASHIREGHGSLRKTDSIDLAGHHVSERRTDLEERTLKAR